MNAKTFEYVSQLLNGTAMAISQLDTTLKYDEQSAKNGMPCEYGVRAMQQARQSLQDCRNALLKQLTESAESDG